VSIVANISSLYSFKELMYLAGVSVVFFPEDIDAMYLSDLRRDTRIENECMMDTSGYVNVGDCEATTFDDKLDTVLDDAVEVKEAVEFLCVTNLNNLNSLVKSLSSSTLLDLS
jgi:hypothetical protein